MHPDKQAWPVVGSFEKKTIELGCLARKEEFDWLKRCAIGEVKSFSQLGRLPSFLKNAGFLHCSIRYLGGLRLLIECNSTEDLNKLTKDDTNWYGDWLSHLSPWSIQQEQARPGRVVWLNIAGVPLHT